MCTSVEHCNQTLKTLGKLLGLTRIDRRQSSRMEHEVRKYYRYKRDIRFMLVTSGLWPDYREHPRWMKIFLSVCSGFASLATALGMVNFCLHNFSNINVLTRGLGLSISYFSSFLKVFILAVHRKDLLALNNGVSTHFEKDLENPESRPHLLAHYRVFSKFFYTFYYSVALNISMMVISPLLAVRHGKYIRAYPQLPPFSYEPGGTVHWIIYAFEALSGYYCFSITVGVDSVFGYYALHLVGELRLLAARFQNLKPGDNYKKELKECVDRHVVLMKAKLLMEQVFGFLSMWLAVTCAIVMCAIIFQCTEMQTKNVTAYRAIYLLCYCFLKLVQAYSYAWFGNIISVESEKCLDAIYNADWAISGNLQHMNDVLIIQSQNPMIFKAKSVMIVQLDMFMKVVKTSVSYFCLLQTLDENQERLS